jgi:deoxyribodipyrimidine photolyase-like uncharacterized protein
MKGIGKNDLDRIQRRYHNCELQMAEVEYFRDELKFLRNLSDTYFLDFLKSEHQGQIHVLVNRLDIFEAKVLNIMDTISLNMHHLILTIQGKATNKIIDYNQEKNILRQSELKDFSEEIKLLKKEMFYIAERFMKNEELDSKQI